MKTVDIRELEADLSGNLLFVTGGEEVLVCDQDRPIARIVPVAAASAEHSEQDLRLIASGVLRPRRRALGEPPYIPTPVITSRPITKEFMDAFWEEERAGRA